MTWWLARERVEALVHERERTIDIRAPGREREAQIPFAGGAERRAGKKGDAVLLEELRRELRDGDARGLRDRGDIGKRVKRTRGRVDANAGDCREPLGK